MDAGKHAHTVTVAHTLNKLYTLRLLAAVNSVTGFASVASWRASWRASSSGVVQGEAHKEPTNERHIVSEVAAHPT